MEMDLIDCQHSVAAPSGHKHDGVRAYRVLTHEWGVLGPDVSGFGGTARRARRGKNNFMGPAVPGAYKVINFRRSLLLLFYFLLPLSQKKRNKTI